MKAEKTFAWQSLVAALIVNALMLAAIYYIAQDTLQTTSQLVTFAVIGLTGTLILWAVIRWLSGRMVQHLQAEIATVATSAEPVAKTVVEATKPEATPTSAPLDVEISAEAGAVQMLAILQRQGRLVDFLQEDLAPFEDAQIGAAVRSVHAGCKQALDEHIQLEAIYTEPEGSRVTVESGFDAYAVRLSGNVHGEPPFSGTLQHRGWRAVNIELPIQMDAQRDDQIVAAAEIEIA